MTENINIPITLKIYGRQPVFEALRSQCDIPEIWLARGTTAKSIKLIEEGLEKHNTLVHWVDKNEIQKIVGPVVHQGMAAIVTYNGFIDDDSLEPYLEKYKNPLILILDQVQDPHNLGAILRTTEITNADLIVVPLKGSAPINATVVKTSAGALFGIKIHQTINLLQLIKQLQYKGISIFGSTVSARQTIFQVDFTNPTALVIGSEDKGIRKNIQLHCDELIKIPQFGKLNSLNVSVSTAIIMYEIIRQRYFNNRK